MRYWTNVSIDGVWTFVAHVSRIDAGGPLLGITTDTTPKLAMGLSHVGLDTELSLTTTSGSLTLTFAGQPTSATLTVTANGVAAVAQLGLESQSGSLADPVVAADALVCLGWDVFMDTEGSFDLFDARLYSKILSADALTGWREDITQSKFLTMPMR